jgi:predicted CXXCH cytochrome family protein
LDVLVAAVAGAVPPQGPVGVGALGSLFEGKEHLLRMAGLFGLGVGVFLVVKGILVPADFGVYGHYRAGALADNKRRAPAYAGRAACAECHPEAAEAIKGGSHRPVGCEACHGALARHVEDATAQKALRPDTRAVCIQCHAADPAKPAKFPQVDPREHAAQGACTECHTAHSPGQ